MQAFTVQHQRQLFPRGGDEISGADWKVNPQILDS